MKRISTLLLAAALAVPAACGSDPTTAGDDVVGDDDQPGDEWDDILASRQYDYGAALRIAALRLTGDLPTLSEINEITASSDLGLQKAAYEARVTEYLTRQTFGREMFYFWRDTFKIGETAEFDTAPAFAAQLSNDNASYMNLFTSATGNCPTYNDATMTFTAGECTGTAPQAGVLSNPGVMKQYFGNFAFRRVKWVQESFDCTKFPVSSELTGPGQEVGGPSLYTGLWPFTSIGGASNTGRVNFQDVSAVICANCHQTLNHLAPLFANFDGMGVYQPAISVPTPLEGSPLAQITDYYPAGETTAWRFGVAAATLPELGSAMAADPLVAKCGVTRVWNWAMGKGDVVDKLEEVPAETVQGQVDRFTANGYKIKDLVKDVLFSDDFTKF
ncbi:MAG: hypothetical protein ABI867_22670 [Kofleriaceae bacterium]